MQDLHEALRFVHSLGQGHHEVVTVDDGHSVLVSSSTPTITDLEKFRERPNRIVGQVELIDVPSFALYVSKYATAGTVLIGDRKGNVTAHLDYHEGPELPTRSTHKAVLRSIKTPEWTTIENVLGKPLTQEGFAEVLEELEHVFVSPDAAKIAEICLNVKGSVTATFESRVNRSNGTVSFCYTEDADKGTVKIPEFATIQVPIFEHSDAIEAKLLIRHKVSSGKIVFTLAIPNAARLVYNSNRELFAAVAAATSMPVLVGV